MSLLNRIEKGQSKRMTDAYLDDLKSRVQAKLLAQLDPSLDMTKTDAARASIKELFDSMLAEENIILSRRERTQLFETIVADILKQPTSDSHPLFRLRWPTRLSKIIQPFGSEPEYYRSHYSLPGHDGIDFFVQEGDPVFAGADGVVDQVGPEPRAYPEGRSQSWGYAISIRHRLPDAQYVTIYSHLQQGSALVKPGETVTAGQQIAQAGATGNVTTPVLHFGLMQDGISNGEYGPYIDPMPFLELPEQETDEDDRETEREDDETAPREEPVATATQVGSTFALNDRPRGDDRLGFSDYARAFAAMLTNPATRPPLTIGVYGAWGMGKSFLMQMIREALEKNKSADAPEFVFVEFNAWVYSGSQNLWAGLVSRIYERVEERLGRAATTAFRLGQNRAKQVGRISLRFIASIALTVALAVLAGLDQIARIWTDLPTVLGASSVLALVLGVGSALVNTINFVGKAYTERAQQLRQMASRPDFRDQIGFMADIKSEIDFVTELLAKQGEGKSTRVVIFIDDLDRCPPTKAIEVLEAIMLLLSEDESPFYVFLGIDARILVKAVEERYGKVLTEAGISGYEYLDKIVQIPFTIPATDETGIKNYIRALLPRPGEESPRALIRPPAPAPDGQTPSAAASTPAPQPNLPATSTPAQQPVNAPPVETPPPRPAVEVSFTTDEQQTFDDFAPYLSRNPRRAKRIVNIYRLVRILDKVSQSCLTAARSRQLIKWVILTEQWPYRMGLIIGQRENAEQLGEGKGSRDGDTLADLYSAVADKLIGAEGRRLLYLDDDPELFGNFIERDSTPITAADIRAFEPLTFNLNPALGGEIRLMLTRTRTMPMPAANSPVDARAETESFNVDQSNEEKHDD